MTHKKLGVIYKQSLMENVDSTLESNAKFIEF